VLAVRSTYVATEAYNVKCLQVAFIVEILHVAMNNVEKYFIYVIELVLHITVETYVVNTVIFRNKCYCLIPTESPDGTTVNEIVNRRKCIINIHDVPTCANT